MKKERQNHEMGKMIFTKEIWRGHSFLEWEHRIILKFLFWPRTIRHRTKQCCRAKISQSLINGKWKDTDGQIRKLAKGHPCADKDGYVREHRLIMEEYLGRFLESKEFVHHNNGKRDDNSLENLELMKSGEHCAYHSRGNKNWLGKRHKKSTKEKISKARIRYFERESLYGY